MNLDHAIQTTLWAQALSPERLAYRLKLSQEKIDYLTGLPRQRGNSEPGRLVPIRGLRWPQ